jgi:hypothetical protein
MHSPLILVDFKATDRDASQLQYTKPILEAWGSTHLSMSDMSRSGCGRCIVTEV